VRVYALLEIGDNQAIDSFVRPADALAALKGCIQDEPEWADLLFVAPIELDERAFSMN
jgi:hypothetical protein